MEEASGYQFYNTSKYNFELLLVDPDNIESNFKNYVAGFSPNIQDVLAIVKTVSNAYSIYKEVDNIKHINLSLVRKNNEPGVQYEMMYFTKESINKIKELIKNNIEIEYRLKI